MPEEKNTPYAEFGKKLTALRKKNHFSRQQLGDLCGVAASTIVNYERGTRIPYADTALRMAQIFGMTVEEIESFRQTYRAMDYVNGDERIRKVLNTFIDGTWNGDRDDFRTIYDELLMKNDEYFVLADFDSYVQAQEQISARYQDRHAWARSCLINIAKSGYFSSDF